MADPDTQPDPHAARLALDTAVHQLTQPTTIPINRDGPEHPDVAQVEAEHHAQTTRLRQQHADARQRRDAPAMRRALTRLIAHEQQHRARRTDRGWTPPLLDQLRDAVESSSSSGGAASAGAHRSPIGLAAAELLADIERTVGRGNPHHQLRTWAAHAGHWQTTNPDQLHTNATTAQRWAATAHAILNPTRRLTAAGACPVCGRDTVHAPDDTGEIVRRPALELDPTTGSARCTAPSCTGYWPAERIQLLATVLEDQARERAAQRQRAQLDDHPSRTA